MDLLAHAAIHTRRWEPHADAELPHLFRVDLISGEAVSHLADNVVLLQYLQEGPELTRALTVVKTRAMCHRPMVHRYEITSGGFELGEVVALTR